MIKQSEQSRPAPAEASSAPVRVRAASASDARRWNDFVNVCASANFYQRYEWQEINATHLRHATQFLLAERGEEVVGVLPLVHVRSRLFGHVLSSMPFVNFGGPAATDESIECALVAAACAHADASRCDYLELRATRPLNDLRTSTDKVSMTIKLEADADAQMAAFTSKHRRNVRVAQKNNLEVRSGSSELLRDFHHILSLSWQSLGTPLYQEAYFADILRRFGSEVRIFVVYHEGVPVAAAFNGYFRDTVEGIWAGVSPAHRELQPNYVLYWEMIRHACDEGFKFYHLGRSTKDSGATQFKEKWLAQPKQLYWNYHLVRRRELPALNPKNPKYAAAIGLWKRLPLSVLRWLGPPLARLIP